MTNVKNSLESFSIYCGTYSKFNNSNLYGKWLNLSDYSDFNGLMEAMRELHNDEDDPEFHFQDYECSEFFINQNLIGESFLSDEIYQIAEKLDSSSYDFDVIEAFGDCFGQNNDINELLDKVSENYYGYYDSDEDFAENLLNDMGEIPQSFPSYIYIDYEKTARNLMFDFSCSNNHYFRNY
ncbi:MAG: antirestriction protein ArdA [Kaistella sp.]